MPEQDPSGRSGGPKILPSRSAEISDRMVELHLEQYGRGPESAKTYITDGLVVCKLRGIYTEAERAMIAAGHFPDVQARRLLLHNAADGQMRRAVERVTKSPVLASFGLVSQEPPVAAEVFLTGPVARSQ